ncbi:SMP-30/gluconolactonase/LRE family protein [Roseicella frigidaeris]|uniref:SMP-30/gluconolactonase/LRE family protein n=1 Tax=Roseicella frigidaeris TaxID=2230885 RepID=A0A327MCW1_9PROT|nr:SMP-30/gluconolactonase/LRE family protein [Roseicella frigidaeris]RAI58018.1 SMP-30/gluconolactonase/LRE family protein [Roseicella frigidaeris]
MHPTSRRGLLAAAGAVAAAPVAARPLRPEGPHPPRVAAAWEPTERYPDPRVQVLDPSFVRYRLFNAAVERLWTGNSRWNEGPVWFGDARCVIWSDIPNDRMLRWSETTGRVDEFRKPSGHSNGNTRDRQGRLVTCEHAGRRVSRTEWDGRVVTLCDSYQGKRLNSPNDVVVKSDGSIWFTDPPFGILGEYEGDRATPELPTNVYRIDGQSGAVTVVAGDVNRPNGIAFSPDESKLYIAENGVMPRVIRVFDVVDGTRLANGRAFFTCEPTDTPDGFRVDADGNLWCGWGMGEGLDGVRVLNPAGKPIGFISLPERCPNLCFGGAKRNRLFMVTGRALYGLYVGVSGAA